MLVKSKIKNNYIEWLFFESWVIWLFIKVALLITKPKLNQNIKDMIFIFKKALFINKAPVEMTIIINNIII